MTTRLQLLIASTKFSNIADQERMKGSHDRRMGVMDMNERGRHSIDQRVVGHQYTPVVVVQHREHKA